MMQYILNNSTEFFVVSVGMAILIISIGKSSPDILGFVKEIIIALITEFSPRKNKLTIEIIDAIMIILSFMLILICLLIDNSPSFFKQFEELITKNQLTTQNNKQYYNSIVAVVIFLFTCCISPWWTVKVNREKAFCKKSGWFT